MRMFLNSCWTVNVLPIWSDCSLYEEKNGKYYHYHHDKATFDDAEEQCVNEGGHLAKITSQDDLDAIKSYYGE